MKMIKSYQYNKQSKFQFQRLIKMLSRSPNKSSTSSIPQDKLKIIIRIRPVLNEQDDSQFVQLEDNHTLQIKRPGNYSFMKFNNILPNFSTQKDVFNLLQDSINQFLSGTNITIFAYGQTGAGKTYSTIGNYSFQQNYQNIYNLLSSQQRGILSRSLQMIMECLEGEKFKITISFFQIYNEKIFDLYNKDSSIPLDIRQSKAGEISIPGLTNIQITKIQEAIQYLMVGLKNRATGSTHANAQSSRSHSVFQINLQKDQVLSSLRIVDLAGSQKFKIPSDLSSAQKQLRIQQLTSINGSLSCLGHCISALIQKSRTHIPFRNSKLTRILSDSLLGQGKMRFIICISPSISASAQTFSTLQFANRAKRAIFQRAQMKTPPMSKKKSQSEQMIILRKQLSKQKQIRITYQKQMGQIKKQNIYLKSQNDRLHQKIKELTIKNLNHSNINQSHSHKNEKSSRVHTQTMSQYNKQNNLKEQMLKLPIFQKSRLNNQPSQEVLGSRSTNKTEQNINLNKKKLQFQKKIRKFIEQDQPQDLTKKKYKVVPQRHQQQATSNNPFSKKSESHKNQRNQKIEHQIYQQNKYQIEPNIQNQTSSQLDMSLYHEQETEQFIQKACEKMNMKEYNQLKMQMQRAKNELLNLKKMDDQIQKRTYTNFIR